MVTNNILEQAQQLLNFNEKLDIGLLDAVVNCMYNGEGEQQRVAQNLLTTLKEHPESWTRADTILEYAQHMQTKYFALQILDNAIKTKWKVLPRDQREGIKTYIVSLIIRLSSDPTSMESQRIFLSKLNQVLVQILKKEWPKNWPSFIPDIVGSSHTSEWLCWNNMRILQLLSEEIFDFSSGQLTQVKIKHLKDTMCQEFTAVFQLCQSILTGSTNVHLVLQTLQTLLRFLNWIPLGFIFETKLVEMLTSKFLVVPMFRNVTLKCLTEIVGIDLADTSDRGNEAYQEAICELFRTTIGQIKAVVPLETPFQDMYGSANDDQKFIQNLSMFFGTSLRVYSASLFERQMGYEGPVSDAHQYLLIVCVVCCPKKFAPPIRGGGQVPPSGKSSRQAYSHSM